MKAAASCCLLAFILGVLPAPLDAEVGPIRVSQDGRYFVDQTGTPFFWLGDTQWELFHAFGVQDAALICEHRKNQGFSVLQIMILGVGGGTKPNAQGEKPFVNDDPLTPNERYFAQVDRVVETANQKGLVCAIGIYHKSNDYGRLITQAKARGWARWVAQRYQRFPNVIWSMYPEAKQSYTPIVRDLAAGLREGDDGRHLITVHPDPSPASSSQPWHQEDWLTFNTIQTWNSGVANYQMVAADYARAPVKPVVNGEARYEDEGGTTPQDIRRGAYWSSYRIVYETYRENNWELFLVNADGSDPVNLTKTPDINELYPHVSPDGAKICFLVNAGKGAATRRSAWYMNLDGTGRTKVADDVREACWSPDGTALALLRAEFPDRYVHEDYASKGLAIYDVATGKISEHPNKALHHLLGLYWAPNGKWFLATVYGGMGYGHTTLAFEAQGTKVFDLHIPGCRPDLTLDGNRLAWGSSVAELSLADIDLRGEKPALSNRRVFVGAGNGMKVYHIDWSPDGKSVAFSRGPEKSDMGPAPEQPGVTGPGWNICVGNPATGEFFPITTDGNSNKEPDWVPAKATAGGGAKR